jgi:hypothetical protein
MTMAVSYAAGLKTSRMQLMADIVASKTAAAATGTATAGQLVIGTSALSGGTGVLCTITLPATAFVVSGSVATLQGTPLSATATATGTAALAEIRNNAGTMVVSGLTVGTTAADIILNSTSITSTQTVTITAPSTITHSA